MTLLQTIQQHVENFPPEKQAEVLDFVLFVEQRLQTCSKASVKTQENELINQDKFQPAIALQNSGLMGCADGAVDLSENYKEYLGRYWAEKHDHC
ncbi:hypothetical protein [Candidatus Venteria ishoeyi]|uniref:DUF2281 domain-containing protein n=1 Tax=Candidatus Venteria ishoeyi TaxID=1899563 RepID=A0A1H6FDR8_9GAMM|nr:hypothetical protein [Candidatus Venteria ishoeyi]MDM8547041.1 hypothetical protein [Candidatus Venteria ishoeyi]SEH08230.1 Uncharacterised protein [Candidatus Venteria ishoeyi]